jgi:hypothetical protein
MESDGVDGNRRMGEPMGASLKLSATDATVCPVG